MIEPAKELVSELTDRLEELVPNIVGEPRVNGSIFRLHRDTRFGKDKRPYKTNQGIYWWEGPSKKVGTGFYLSLEPTEVVLGVGSIAINDLEAWRAAIADERGEELLAALAKAKKDLRRLGEVGWPEPELKRVPRGFDSEHPRGEFLRMKRFHCTMRVDHPSTIHSARFADWLMTRFAPLAPVHRWLYAHSMPT